jgi:hypothetical protein
MGAKCNGCDCDVTNMCQGFESWVKSPRIRVECPFLLCTEPRRNREDTVRQKFCAEIDQAEWYHCIPVLHSGRTRKGQYDVVLQTCRLSFSKLQDLGYKDR